MVLCYQQLINEFVKKERIPLDGVRPAEILLGRDTRPSGSALLKAAREVWVPQPILSLYHLLFYSLSPI